MARLSLAGESLDRTGAREGGVWRLEGGLEQGAGLVLLKGGHLNDIAGRGRRGSIGIALEHHAKPSSRANPAAGGQADRHQEEDRLDEVGGARRIHGC